MPVTMTMPIVHVD